MSASLVGSEMCIRDSFRGGGGATGRQSGGGGQSTGGGGGSNTAGQQRPCLLYTSDAADDM
eukprot:12869657-Alexandrium_andersonii.AAC.1